MKRPTRSNTPTAASLLAEKTQADKDLQFRLYRIWRREQINDALNGPYGEQVKVLRAMLRRLAPDSKQPVTGRALQDWVEASPLRQADETTRRTVMHMIGQGIRWAREKRGLPGHDDPLPVEWGGPGQESAWQGCKRLMDVR